MATTAAVLDACVLIPVTLCDVLLRAADSGLYVPLWSDQILDEMERNLVEQHLTDAQGARRRAAAMRAAFPDATVSGYERLINSMPNHPKDRHVLAVAVAAEASAIVTFNLRHFPQDALRPLRVQAQSPDEFLTNLLSAEPEVMVQLIREQAAFLRRPPSTSDDVLDRLARHARRFAALARALHHGEP